MYDIIQRYAAPTSNRLPTRVTCGPRYWEKVVLGGRYFGNIQVKGKLDFELLGFPANAMCPRFWRERERGGGWIQWEYVKYTISIEVKVNSVKFTIHRYALCKYKEQA